MFGRHEFDALVVGAGPVGLFSALALAERGIKTRIVDEERRQAAHSYALALHPRSLALLDSFGVVEELLERGLRVERFAFYEGGERRGLLDLSALPEKFPFLLVVPQRVVEGVLEHALRRRGVKVEWNHRISALEQHDPRMEATVEQLDKVSSGYATATTEWVVEKKLTYRPRFVVGADGHRSTVRALLDLDYPSHGDPVCFAVFELECARPVEAEVRVVFHANGTNVLWPLPEGRARWSFQVETVQLGEPRLKSRLAVRVGNELYTMVDREHLDGFLAERAPWFDVEIKDLPWSVLVRFESRLASRFGRNLTWLVGDAAHQTGPVGMQSMNVGLAEAAELVERFEAVRKEPRALHELEEFNDRCLAEWRRLLGIEGALRPAAGAAPWVRQNAARIVPCIPGGGEQLLALAAQIGLEPAQAEAGTGGS
jgi:2-polyprenyl-6-methoxyphenol hydroxylase-like FAD-dependent oxidoreductase